MDFCLSWPLPCSHWPMLSFYLNYLFIIRLRTQRPFCMGHTINTHYHGYVLLSWWRKTIYEEIRFSQVFYNLFYYSLKITYAVKKMNPVVQLAVLSAPSTWLWSWGELKCGSQYIYVSNLLTPSPHVHTYFIHHSDSLHKQTVLIFFKPFTQIECDVELIILVRQELEDVHCCGAFIPVSTQLPPHCTTDFSATHTQPLRSSQRSLVFSSAFH